MIDYDVDGDGIATLAWNMADRPMNVLNDQSVPAFQALIERALENDGVKGIIITSKKADFVAGADLTRVQGQRDPAVHFEAGRAFQSVIRTYETGGKPVVAAINGHALGGGFEICLGCHRRIAADDPKILIGLVEVSIGLLPGGGGTQRLPRLIGARQALPLMLEGKRLGPKDALAAGLVDAVVPREKLLDAAKAWILEDGNATQPWDEKRFKVPGGAPQTPQGFETFIGGNAMLHARSFGNYPAAQAIMSCVYEGLGVPLDIGLKLEARHFAGLASGDAAQNMIRSLFFSMGEANKLARRPKDVAPSELNKIGVLGAGLMGAGVAHVSALAGLEVVLLDTGQDLADKGKAHSAELLEKRVQRKRMSAEARDAALGRITPTTDFGELDGCDLVIEAVFENRDIKAEVTKKSEAVIAENAVFASNTSTLPITGLAEASARPGNFIGIHFFSPVDRMQLVEIIVGKETSDAALALAMDYVKRIKKTPIVVNDSRGFYTSRVFATYVREGLALLAEGVTPALIENAGKMAGMPLGPLALADEVSIGLMHHVLLQTRTDLGEDYRPSTADDVICHMVEDLDRAGKKGGKGFYDYGEGGSKRLWPGLTEEYALAAEQPDVEAVKRRMLYVQGIETARCLEENVVTTPADADVGSILGWGFPPFLGGPLSMIQTVGLEKFVAQCDELAQIHGERFAPPEILRHKAAAGEAFYAA